jgi:hypothetical protein
VRAPEIVSGYVERIGDAGGYIPRRYSLDSNERHGRDPNIDSDVPQNKLDNE